MKKNVSTLLLILTFIAGLSLLLYPSVANWWNTKVFNEDIASYTMDIASVDNSELEEMIFRAEQYNIQHSANGNTFGSFSDEYSEEYNSQLSLKGSSMMGYLSIPKVNVMLPIYHGTSNEVLASGIGHLEGTSLPVGGENTHCVLSGHRGLPSARLLTDLDQMVVGDIFTLEIYGMTYTYEVDLISIVLPEELGALDITRGLDLCTLVTCTPYGVNSHRLLVRGHRIANASGEVRVVADARQIEPIYVAPFVATPMLLLLVVLLMTAPSPKRKKK